MVTKDLYVEFDGRPRADIVSAALSGLSEVLEGLSDEYEHESGAEGANHLEAAPDARQVEWTFGGNQDGTFGARLVGTAESRDALDRIALDALDVQRRVQAGEVTAHSEKVERGARKFLKSVNGYVSEARLRYDEDRVVVSGKVRFPKTAESQTRDYGSVEGRVVAMFEARGGGAEVVVIDQAYRSRVRCRIPAALVPAAKDAWGGRATVEGRVVRDVETGEPVRVEDVAVLEPLEAFDEGALLRVAGIWEAPPGYEIVTSRALSKLGPGEDG